MKLVTTANQWTMMTENILNTVTTNSDDAPANPVMLGYTEHYPFLPRNAPIPNDNTGYVDLLLSHSNPHFFIYWPDEKSHSVNKESPIRKWIFWNS